MADFVSVIAEVDVSGKLDAQAQQAGENREIGHGHGTERADVGDGFLGDINQVFEELNIEDGDVGAVSDGNDEQNREAADVKASLNSDSENKNQPNVNASVNSDSESEDQPSNKEFKNRMVDWDELSSSEIESEKSDSDAGLEEEEEWSDDGQMGFDLREVSGDDGFNAQSYWRLTVEEPARMLARIMEKNDTISPRPPPLDPDFGLFGIPRDYVAKPIKLSDLKWHFGEEYCDPDACVMPPDLRWIID